MPGRDNAQCLQRWNKVLKPGLVKGPWSVDEDNLLMETMLKGYDSWREVAAQIPGRTYVVFVIEFPLVCVDKYMARVLILRILCVCAFYPL